MGSSGLMSSNPNPAQSERGVVAIWSSTVASAAKPMMLTVPASFASTREPYVSHRVAIICFGGQLCAHGHCHCYTEMELAAAAEKLLLATPALMLTVQVVEALAF